MVWKHVNPVGTGKYDGFSSTVFVNHVELDPTGADVGLTEAPPQDTAGGDGDVGSNHFAGLMAEMTSDVFNPAGGCVVNGHSENCGLAMLMVNFGTGNRTNIFAVGANTGVEIGNAVKGSASPEALFAANGNDLEGFTPGDSSDTTQVGDITDSQDPNTLKITAEMTVGFVSLTAITTGGLAAINTSLPQNPAALAPNGLASKARLSDQECDDYLARIFGGPDARVGSTRDPDTLLQNAGTPRPPGHGPAPFNNPNPNSSDRGGIIHVYGNPEGTATGAALYAPSGGTMGSLYTHEDEYGDPDYTGRRVTYRTGLTISFVHVGSSRGPGRTGSVRVGNIGGLGGEKPPGYIHTHTIFYSDFKNRVRVDPRKVFCGQ